MIQLQLSYSRVTYICVCTNPWRQLPYPRHYMLLLNRVAPSDFKLKSISNWQSWISYAACKDANTVKPGFHSVPPQLILNLPLFFWPSYCRKKSGKFWNRLNWFESRYYCAGVFNGTSTVSHNSCKKCWNIIRMSSGLE